MKNKPIKKIIISVIAVFLVVVIGFFADAFFGNPVSKVLVKNAAEKHLADVYSNSDFEIAKVFYDFKGSNYNVHVISPVSKDSEFALVYNMFGKLLADTYVSSVIERGNTSSRISYEYHEKVRNVFENTDFSFEWHVGFGDIEFIQEKYKDEPYVPSYAIITDTLVLDAEYDINKMASDAGHLTVHAYDDAVSEKRLAEMLIELKVAFDKADVTFYSVNFVLEHFKQEGNTQSDNRVEVIDFLYKDITEKGLVKKVEKANKAAIEYYKQQDAEKLAEQEIMN